MCNQERVEWFKDLLLSYPDMGALPSFIVTGVAYSSDRVVLREVLTACFSKRPVESEETPVPRDVMSAHGTCCTEYDGPREFALKGSGDRKTIARITALVESRRVDTKEIRIIVVHNVGRATTNTQNKLRSLLDSTENTARFVFTTAGGAHVVSAGIRSRCLVIRRLSPLVVNSSHRAAARCNKAYRRLRRAGRTGLDIDASTRNAILCWSKYAINNNGDVSRSLVIVVREAIRTGDIWVTEAAGRCDEICKRTPKSSIWALAGFAIEVAAMHELLMSSSAKPTEPSPHRKTRRH